MIAVVDYGVCNLGSVLNMFKRVGVAARAALTPADLEQAEKIVLPGVGRFDQGVGEIKARGLWDALDCAVRARGVPVLGICLGMQLMFESSEEGQLPGFGWVSGTVRRFMPAREGLPVKVPNMGWSQVKLVRDSVLWRGLPEHPRFYFVHSYYCQPADPGITIGEAVHDQPFCAALEYRNVLGVQFHPEKSHAFGMRVLGNFAGA